MRLPICWQQQCLSYLSPFVKICNLNVHDLDLQNGSMLNINIPIERPYATSYLLAIALFALSVIVCEILTVEMRMTLTLTSRMGQDQMQICHSKGHMRLFCVGNNYVCSICHRLRDNHLSSSQ